MIYKTKGIFVKILSLLFVLSCALSIVACVKPANNDADDKIKFEQIDGYTLVLNEYNLKNPDKILEIINPKGQKVEFTQNPFIPTMVGDYQIIYNNKTEVLTVLIKSDSMVFDVESDLDSEYIAGHTITIPSVSISDDYKQYSAYSVTVKVNGQTYTSFNNVKKGVPLLFELKNSGEYEIEYSCIDGFGQVNQTLVNFSVVDEPVIVFEKVEENYSYGDTVQFASPFGYYKGVKYPVTISISTPSQGDKILFDSNYVLKEDGNYTVLYSCNINGQNVQETQDFTVNYSAKNIANVKNGEIEVAVDLPEYSKIEGQGVCIKGLSDFAFDYEPIIDLNNLTKNDNLISFLPYSDDNALLTDLTLTLTDIYDENNSVTLYWYAKSHWGIGHSYLTVRRPNGDYGISNEVSDGAKEFFGKVRPEGAVIYSGSFFGKQNATSDIFAVQFDVLENKVYYTVEGKQELLLDLDDEPEISFEDRFYGFTTGEVYLTIKTINNSNAGIYITELAGESFKGDSVEISNYKNNYAVLDKLVEKLPIGEVNLAYPIPQVSISNNCKENVQFDIKVYHNGIEQNISNANKFTPTQSGEYTIVYKGEYIGFEIEKVVNFDVVDSLGEITLDFNAPNAVVSGEAYNMPAFEVGGIDGEYRTEVVIKDSKQVFAKNMFGEFILNTNENAIIEIYVEDAQLPDRNKTFTFEIPIISKTVLQLKGDLPKTVRAGAKVFLPDFNVSNSSTDNALDKRIVINFGQANETLLIDSLVYTVPNNVESIFVTYIGGYDTPYQTDNEKYTYELKVIPEDASIGELLGVDAPSIAKLINGENGLSITTYNSGKLLEMPYSLPTTDLLFKFSLRKNRIAFSKIKIVLTDSVRSDKQVILYISNIADGKANLTVNSDNTNYQIKYTTNGNFYDFDLNIKEFEKSIFDASNKVVAKLNTYSDNTSFNGFSNYLAYLSVELENVRGVSEFIVNEVGNQQFGYYMTAFGKKDNDNNGPMIYTDFRYSTIEAEYGSTVNLPKMFAKDVLQTSSNITLTIVDPEGSTLKNNVSLSAILSFKAEKYGKYNLTYTAKDSLGNKTEKRITVSVKDRILPEITVNGTYKSEYKVGQSVKIISANASDNNTVDLKIYVFVKDSAGTLKQVQIGEEFKFTRAGTHKIIYRTEDSDLNVKTVEFDIDVKV